MAPKIASSARVMFPTGCDILDLIVGGAPDIHGFPSGKFINLVGDKSSGKTFLGMEIIAAAYHKYGSKKFKWRLDDCESGFSFDTTKLYGFPIMPDDPAERTRSETVEDLFCNISDFAAALKPGQFGIYMCDSLDGLTSEEQEEQAAIRLATHAAVLAGKKDKIVKGSYGMGKPKYLSREFFPQLCTLVEDKSILVIIISQVRENIDPMSFEKFSRSGGKALDFYCHTVMWLANLHKIKRKARTVGVVVKAKTTKSKTPRPYREGMFTLMFDYGLDNIGTGLDFLFDLRSDKNGEILKVANSIRWTESEKPTIAGVKSFLEDGGWLKEFLESDISSGKYKLVEADEWIDSQPEIKKAFNAKYGSTMTRDELIQFIDDNDLRQELTDRVRAKWEEIETSIATVRKPKYPVAWIA